MSTYTDHDARNRGGHVASPLERHLADKALAAALGSIDPGPSDEDVDNWAIAGLTPDERDAYLDGPSWAASVALMDRCVDCDTRTTYPNPYGLCPNCALAHLEGTTSLLDLEVA